MIITLNIGLRFNYGNLYNIFNHVTSRRKHVVDKKNFSISFLLLQTRKIASFMLNLLRQDIISLRFRKKREKKAN